MTCPIRVLYIAGHQANNCTRTNCCRRERGSCVRQYCCSATVFQQNTASKLDVSIIPQLTEYCSHANVHPNSNPQLFKCCVSANAVWILRRYRMLQNAVRALQRCGILRCTLLSMWHSIRYHILWDAVSCSVRTVGRLYGHGISKSPGHAMALPFRREQVSGGRTPRTAGMEEGDTWLGGWSS